MCGGPFFSKSKGRVSNRTWSRGQVGLGQSNGLFLWNLQIKISGCPASEEVALGKGSLSGESVEAEYPNSLSFCCFVFVFVFAIL